MNGGQQQQQKKEIPRRLRASASVALKIVLELFSNLQSCLLWKILYEKVKHDSVAQLVHEILLKVSKVYFFNFHDFVSFFTNFFHLNILISKNMFSEVFSLTIAFIRIRKVKISVDWSFLMKQNTIFSDLGATSHLKLDGPT